MSESQHPKLKDNPLSLNLPNLSYAVYLKKDVLGSNALLAAFVWKDEAEDFTKNNKTYSKEVLHIAKIDWTF